MLVRRDLVVGRSGRTTINGHLVTLAMLRRVTAGLVDITSQHQHVALREHAAPLNLLDHVSDSAATREAYGEAWTRFLRALDDLERLEGLAEARMEREDFARYHLDELCQAELVADEEEALRTRRARLTYADTLGSGLSTAEGNLTANSTSVITLLVETSRTLSNLETLDPTLSPLRERIEAARIEVEDVAYDLGVCARDIEANPGELERVQGRLHMIERLKRKHRLDLPGLLAKKEALTKELEDLENLEDTVQDATDVVRVATAEARQIAASLSAHRQAAARDLTEIVDGELDDLRMSGARIRFGITVRDTLGADGLDDVALLVQTNPGEGFKPMERVASGGELSRLLLAFKSALTHRDPVCTNIFDEIDSGVGGATAEVVGRKLKGMAAARQVIVVTHQPQIAMHAHQHLHVHKCTQKGRTVTRVEHLDAGGRKEELSRMLGGLTVTSRARKHAEELLARGEAA
jgi:DNA repair protein RecN (Recombination protein N)